MLLEMFNGGQILQPQILHAPPPQLSRRPHVEIVEQPAPKCVRFRYECEGRSENIIGVSSSGEAKTCPAIRVIGYQGRARIVVSCVTKDKDNGKYKAHPHNLVGKDCNDKGLCIVKNVFVDGVTPIKFSNLGIQSVKKKKAVKSLKIRQEQEVDPFLAGFSHANQPSAINLNVLRLCFQVFIEDAASRTSLIPLAPVVSDPLYDKKAVPDLRILEMCSCVCYASGPRNKIIFVCNKVEKNNIQIRFYEEAQGQVIWEAYGDFKPTEVYNRTAISFRPPAYHNPNITEPATVFVHLLRPSNGDESEPLPFQFVPHPDSKRKRKKLDINFCDQLVSRTVDDNVQYLLSASPADMAIALPSMQPSWNILTPNTEVDTLIPLDDQELPPLQLSSGELEHANHLSENLKQSLSLSDVDNNALELLYSSVGHHQLNSFLH